MVKFWALEIPLGVDDANFMKNANDCKFLCSGRDYKCQQLHLCFIENFRSDNGSYKLYQPWYERRMA